MTPFNQRRLLKNQFESIKRPSNLWHRKKLDRQTGCSLAHSPCLKQVGSCSACSINWIYTSSWNLKGLSYLLSLVLSEKTLHFIAINGQTDASKLSTLGGEPLFLIWTRIPRFRILPCKILKFFSTFNTQIKQPQHSPWRGNVVGLGGVMTKRK